MEKSATQILRERKYESKIKRHKAMMQQESIKKMDYFDTVYEKRNDRRKYTLEVDQELDRKGYDRYQKDTKEI